MVSVTRVARDDNMPRPIPGKQYALLHWFVRIKVPLGKVTLSKGLPLANMAFPSVQMAASSAVHSQWLVGLDKGKMTGSSTCLAISRTAPSVNTLAAPLRPRSTVGFTFLTTSSRFMPSASSLRANRERPASMSKMLHCRCSRMIN